jgi:hypothetical protein
MHCHIPLKPIFIASDIISQKLEWGYTQEIFSTALIPAVHKHISESFALSVLSLVLWANKPEYIFGEMIQKIFASFEKHVLEITITYTEETPQTTREELTVHILTSTGSVKKVVRERNISTSDLPGSVREEMITHFGQPIQANVKAYFEEKIRRKLK